MRFNNRALVFTAAIICGASVFLVGLANLIWSGYANTFLQFAASVYPGYDASGSFGDLIVGTIYALVDGAVAGLIFGWLYNMFTGRLSTE